MARRGLTAASKHVQVQGQALLPGAAMFEVVSSAAVCLLPTPVADSRSTSAIVRVAIPAPLPLSESGDPASGGTSWATAVVLSVMADTATGALTAVSQQAAAAPARTHLNATAGSILLQTAAACNGLPAGSCGTAVRAALVECEPGRPVGAATAAVEQPSGGQSGYYALHPAIIDCTTQATIRFCCIFVLLLRDS